MFPSPDGELVGLDRAWEHIYEDMMLTGLFPSPDGELVGLDLIIKNRNKLWNG
ncbi:conserved protein of unknown function [Limnospira indica PCC 8005]|uniref:Uncharacterized protein n=1 Tax=Limnospira indica PCC 8005 TaxID=376219 RepID=A0A9P1KJW1_9CYAN|nr:conserved protein of unknown function [Limnospira indica PCC 8005]